MLQERFESLYGHFEPFMSRLWVAIGVSFNFCESKLASATYSSELLLNPTDSEYLLFKRQIVFTLWDNRQQFCSPMLSSISSIPFLHNRSEHADERRVCSKALAPAPLHPSQSTPAVGPIRPPEHSGPRLDC